MLVTLFRHGIAADRDVFSGPDTERPLTPKGVRRTLQAASGLKVLGLRPAVILTSPLRRAAQTAAIIAEVVGRDGALIRETPTLEPERHPRELLAELAGVQAATVVCVGHAPQLDAALAWMVTGKASALTRIKKAGAACVELTSPTAGKGTLRWLAEPKALRLLGRR